jgi:hypothetical protein
MISGEINKSFNGRLQAAKNVEPNIFSGISRITSKIKQV